MPDPTPETSLRFSRAASAERDRLNRKLLRMAEKREEHEQAIEEIDHAMKALEERVRLLGELATESSATPSTPQLRAAGSAGRIVLRGATIREVAVPLLLRESGESPIHYKHWYELLEKAGYEVLGQRPDAVFLNQVARSPLVKASTQPGIYSIDPSAIENLRSALEEQENHLVDAETPADDSDLETSAERYRELMTSTNRLRRQLEEAERALETGKSAKGHLAEAA